MIQLMQGDCLDKMQAIPSGSVDMVLADIPYGEVNRASNGLRSLDKQGADTETFAIQEALEQVNRVCTGSVYIFCGMEQVSEVRRVLAAMGMTTRLGVWEKTNPSPMNGQHVWLSGVECCAYGKKRGATFNEHCKNSVWRFPTARGKLHPTMKPIPLLEHLINASSHPDDTVLDFTMGSGSTGVACVNTGRSFIGIELDPEYFCIAEQRIAEAQQANTA